MTLTLPRDFEGNYGEWLRHPDCPPEEKRKFDRLMKSLGKSCDDNARADDVTEDF